MIHWLDAEECWVKIADALKDVPLEASSSTSSGKKFVEAYMMGQMRRELRILGPLSEIWNTKLTN